MARMPCGFASTYPLDVQYAVDFKRVMFAVMKNYRMITLLVLLLPLSMTVNAQTDEELAEFARKAQDPLADVKALMTDNTIGFNGGPDESTSYSFQLQPVYSIDNETSWNMILRGIWRIELFGGFSWRRALS
jgi:hypothetical protein